MLSGFAWRDILLCSLWIEVFDRQGYLLGISAKAVERASAKPEGKLILTFLKSKSSAEVLREISAGQTSAACYVKAGTAIECSRTVPVSQVEAWYRKHVRRVYTQMWPQTLLATDNIILCLLGLQ